MRTSFFSVLGCKFSQLSFTHLSKMKRDLTRHPRSSPAPGVLPGTHSTSLLVPWGRRWDIRAEGTWMGYSPLLNRTCISKWGWGSGRGEGRREAPGRKSMGQELGMSWGQVERRSLVACARGKPRSPCKQRSRQRWARVGPGEGKGPERWVGGYRGQGSSEVPWPGSPI